MGTQFHCSHTYIIQYIMNTDFRGRYKGGGAEGILPPLGVLKWRHCPPPLWDFEEIGRKCQNIGNNAIFLYQFCNFLYLICYILYTFCNLMHQFLIFFGPWNICTHLAKILYCKTAYVFMIYFPDLRITYATKGWFQLRLDLSQLY